MIARVLCGAKVSKAKGRSVSVAVIEGLEPEPIVVSVTLSPPDESPTTAQVRAAALGVGTAIARGATDVEVVTPSVAVRKAIAAEPGGGCNGDGALLAGWAIYWTRDLLARWAVDVWAAKDMPEVEAAAKAAMAR